MLKLCNQVRHAALLFLLLLINLSLPLTSHSEDQVINYTSDLGLTEEEKQWLEKHPAITVGYEDMYHPIEFEDGGTYSGMTRDYMNLIAQKLNIQFESKRKPTWSETLDAVVNKEIDILAAAQITPERKNKLLFSEPYVFLNTVMVAAHYKDNAPLSLESLNGKTVATISGYFWNELLPIDYPEIKLLETKDLASGLTAIALGHADAFMDSFATVSHYIKEEEITSINVVGEAPYQIAYAIGIRDDWPLLQSILNKALSSITEQQHQNIRDRWISVNYETPLLNKHLTYSVLASLAAALLALLISLAWSRTLNRKVKSKTAQLQDLNKHLENKVYLRTQELEVANQKLKQQHNELQEFTFKLEDETKLDSLTKIANRKGLDEFLERAIEETQRKEENLSVIMADIDYFKEYNDRYGHLEGDKCLRKVAKLFNNHAKREGELAARFGGEEFTLVLSNIDKDKAMEYSQRLLKKVHNLKIEHQGNPKDVEPFLTCSFGIFTLHPNNSSRSPQQLLEYGDQALYQAKRNGRNQVVHYEDVI